MDDANLDYIEVFKAGEHTDSSGYKREWTEEDLDTIVSKYNNQSDDEKHRAPAVAGSHISDGPAYGWVSHVKKVGKKLLAKFEQVDEGFKNLVNAGRFGTVSIALYPDFKLRHVAFLGAMPPAIKGLKTPQFNDGKKGYISLNYSGDTAVNPPGNWSNLEIALFQRNSKEAPKIMALAKKYFGELLSEAELQVNCGKFFLEMYKEFDSYVCTDAVPMVFYFLGINMSDGQDKQYSYKSESKFSEHPQVIERKNAMKEFADYYNNGRKTKSEIFAEQNNISDKERAFAEMEAKQRGVSFSEVLNKPKSEMQKFIEERNKLRGV